MPAVAGEGASASGFSPFAVSAVRISRDFGAAVGLAVAAGSSVSSAGAGVAAWFMSVSDPVSRLQMRGPL